MQVSNGVFPSIATVLATWTLSFTDKGLWDASTNTPSISSGLGSNGDFYVVSVAGTTTVDGTSSWAVGDYIIFGLYGTPVWSKVSGSGGSSGAPADAKYIVQTPNATLTNEQALSALSTGIMKVTTTTGVVSTAAAGTDYVAPGGALGTPASGTLSNCTGLPIATGVANLGTGVATFLTTPSSANLASAVTDETGSGALVFGTSPTISNPTFTGDTTTQNIQWSGGTLQVLKGGGLLCATFGTGGGPSTNTTLNGTLTTTAPAGGTAAAWSLWSKITSGTSVLDATGYVELDIGGTLYKLALVTNS